MKRSIKYKEKLIISATNYARDILKIEDGLWVFINDLKHFRGIHHCALYDKENFIIRYNKIWLMRANDENIIKTAFHEVFHVIQHLSLLEVEMGIKNILFTNEELKIIKNEFMDRNYFFDYINNQKLFIEKQANSFAEELYLEYNKTFNDSKELIKKYYYKYSNKND